MKSKKAVIVGAGIGGLGAALALRQAGYDIAVYEAAGQVKEVGAGISLWANAIQALKKLGVWDTVKSLAVGGDGGAIYTDTGTLLSAVSIEKLQAELGQVIAVVHRAELLERLYETVGKSVVCLGARCERIEERGDKVIVSFSTGEAAEGDLLIGADGLHSVVRRHLHGDHPPRYAGYTAWRGVVAYPHEDVLPGETWGRGMRFGRVPMSGGRVYWFATANEPAGKRYPDEKAALLERFGHWHAPVPELVRNTPDSAILHNDIYDHKPLAQWGRGRITLLGDAAHAMTPNLGQGACQALEDAVVLGRCIIGEKNVAAALRRYERERAAWVNPIVLQARRVGNAGQWSNSMAVALRNLLVRRIPPRVQHAQLRRLLTHPL
jgi:2-polyprenyl-6-methoxyphenol hydroxylase-like FAD-dependent oxidoreductase